MQIRDCVTVDASGLTLTRDGYLVGEARISRAGNVQQYMGYELGLKDDKANKVFGVYRDPDVVFDERSMLSLAGRPVTRGHPSVAVDASNWKELAKGQIGGTIKRDGEHVVAHMAIMDHASAKEVADGARSLSAGYTVDVVADEGTAPDGTPYQYRQAGELRFNHVAYLPDNNPRAGNTRIGDGAVKWGISPVHVEDQLKGQRSMTTRTITVDGLSVELADKDAQIVQRTLDGLTTKLADAEKRVADADASHKTEIAAKDAEIAKKDAELDAIKAKVLSDADIDKRVQDRAGLITTAQAIAKDLKTDGLSDADIRKAAVAAKLGDEAIKDKSAEYIAVRFDILADEAKKADPVRDALMNRDSNNLGDDASKARAKMIADMQTAHVAQAK